MPNPLERRSIGGIVAALLALAACRPAEPDDRGNRETPAAQQPDTPILPEPAKVIDRSALLGAIGQAASAFAAGTDDSAAQAQLDGKTFSIRLPFACDPSEGTDGSLSLTRRPDGRSYELRAAPTLDRAALGLVDDSTATPSPIQAVEGFWFRRPWLLADTCPAARDNAVRDPAMTMTTDAAASMGGEQSAGIARYVGEGESRIAIRDGRDYRKVVTLAEGEQPPVGLYLVLEGRLRTWPDGKVIACRSTPAGGRPSCVAAAVIDRAAFETMKDRRVIAEWTGN